MFITLKKLSQMISEFFLLNVVYII